MLGLIRPSTPRWRRCKLRRGVRNECFVITMVSRHITSRRNESKNRDVELTKTNKKMKEFPSYYLNGLSLRTPENVLPEAVSVSWQFQQAPTAPFLSYFILITTEPAKSCLLVFNDLLIIIDFIWPCLSPDLTTTNPATSISARYVGSAKQLPAMSLFGLSELRCNAGEGSDEEQDLGGDRASSWCHISSFHGHVTLRCNLACFF